MTEELSFSDVAERLALLARVRRKLSWEEATACAKEILVPWEEDGGVVPRKEIPALVAALNRRLDERAAPEDTDTD